MSNIESSQEQNVFARDTAFSALDDVSVDGTSTIVYQSKGKLLIIADSEQSGSDLRDLFENKLICTVLVLNAKVERKADLQYITESNTSAFQLDGYLGSFVLRESVKNTGFYPPDEFPRQFDLVLDTLESPLIRPEKKPPGYFTHTSETLPDMQFVQDIAVMIGDFEKPKYVEVQSDICAHGRSGQRGCTRCLDACPAEAISSLGDIIQINDELCHGFGVCATACPTGAISYHYPSAVDNVARLQKVLNTYKLNSGIQPQLLILSENLAIRLDIGEKENWNLPGNILPVVLEEQGSFGMDAWLMALVYGASSVALLFDSETPVAVRTEVEHQLSIMGAMMLGMGFPENVVTIIEPPDILADGLNGVDIMPELDSGSFVAQPDKRSTMMLALDYLADAAKSLPETIPLPPESLFGGLEIDTGQCTLCMSCVSVCPAGALADGGELPALRFYQSNCVQCGLCEVSCPESALQRRPEFIFNRERRRSMQVLNEEQPFHCVRCNKAFATSSMIERISTQLANHPMYQEPGALNRLKMCEDCRVIEMMQDELKES